MTVNNGVGTTTSSAANLTINTAPTIATQPISQTVSAGSSVMFTVSALGTAPFTYQWYFGNAAISGATSSTYAISSATPSNAGSYSVIITNAAGNISSNTVILTVATVPNITSQPLPQSVATAANVTLSVAASSSTSLQYQWYFGSTPINGATSSSYTISNFQSTNVGSYYCIISNAAGSSTSATAQLTQQVASIPPTITTQPISQSVNSGSSVTLSVSTTGNTNVSYQWFLNGNSIAGATSSTYIITNAQLANSGAYSAEIIYGGGALFSNTATVTVVTPVVIPTITSQPLTQTVNAGSNVTLNVVATSSTGYQWYFNGTPIAGATSSSYTISNVQSASAGNYTVAIAYSGGTVLSNAATLTVNTPYVAPVITTNPKTQSVTAGVSVTFTVAATGTPAPTYQWYFNSIPITGATGTSYTVANVQPFNSGSYNVLATNPGGSYASNGGILTVTSPNAPAITSQPVSHTTSVGSTVTFSVTATGVNTGGTSINASGLSTKATTNSVYQWYLNGLAIAGATNSVLVTTASASNAGSYQCMVVNSSGSIMSSPATLQVTQTTNPGRLVNLSVLTLDGPGSQMLTLGFVTGGSNVNGNQSLLIRGIGPSLTDYGVNNVLQDPTLTIFKDQSVLNQNSGWASSLSNQIQVISADAATGAFTLKNMTSLDSATVMSLTPASYTVQVASKSGLSGNALAEIYDNTPIGTYTLMSPKLINLSCLQQIGTKGILTAGFVIGGTTAETVLIRVSGPSLTAYGVTEVMPDPQLTVFNSSTVAIGSNSGWSGNPAIIAAETATGAFALTSATSLDSAILLTLDPGNYTVQATSSSGVSGKALIEVYEVPAN